MMVCLSIADVPAIGPVIWLAGGNPAPHFQVWLVAAPRAQLHLALQGRLGKAVLTVEGFGGYG